MSDATTITIPEPTEPATLNELVLRSSRFRGGEPVILDDGQTYYLPKPQVRAYRPTFSGGKIVTSKLATDLGSDFDHAVEEMDGDDSTQPFLDRLFATGAALLLYNYNLTDDDLGRLLIFKTDDEANQELWSAIAGTARGQYAPKLQSGI